MKRPYCQPAILITLGLGATVSACYLIPLQAGILRFPINTHVRPERTPPLLATTLRKRRFHGADSNLRLPGPLLGVRISKFFIPPPFVCCLPFRSGNWTIGCFRSPQLQMTIKHVHRWRVRESYSRQHICYMRAGNRPHTHSL